MQLILVSTLIAICSAVAIPKPQEWGNPSTISGRPAPTYTIVVPCFPGIPNCVVQTLTYAGAYNEVAATGLATREAEPQVLGSPSRTVLLPTPPPYHTTSTKKPITSTKKHYDERQVLGSPSRTVLLPTTSKKPPPHWPTWGPEPTVTVVSRP